MIDDHCAVNNPVAPKSGTKEWRYGSLVRRSGEGRLTKGSQSEQLTLLAFLAHRIILNQIRESYFSWQYPEESRGV